MTIVDLIFMACLQLNMNSDCKEELSNCATSKYSAAVKKYVAESKEKKMSEEDMITKQPQWPWADYVYECTEARKKKKGE